MDTKITLAFDQDIIQRAKAYAEKHDMSLSRMIEMILDKITTQNYKSLEDFPISDWVNIVSEGPAEYKTPRKRKAVKKEYYERKKK